MRKKIVAGLLLWIPIGGTFFVINFLFNAFDKVWFLVPYEYHPEQLFGFKIPGLSFVIVLIVIYITGHLVSNYFGNRLVSLWEKLLDKIPGIRTFYRGIKQMTEAIFISGETSFKKVFLLEYPRTGIWTVGFETSGLYGEPHYLIMGREGTLAGEITPAKITQAKEDKQYTNLFVPTTPNPTSGYFIIANRDELVELEMGVDDALKMIVSGGIYVPDKNQEDSLVATQSGKKRHN